MSAPGAGVSRIATRAVRRHLVGSEQRWVFERPEPGWTPPSVERTSLYLHVPFCRNACPYCPYTKVPYHPELVGAYTAAALREVDAWADAVGRAEVTSVYVGGGTPTLAPEAVGAVLVRMRERFDVTGDVCIETSPSDVDTDIVARLRDAGVRLVSLGVQSFRPESLAAIGRRYAPFDLGEWERVCGERRLPVALRMPFQADMGGWWWLYWRFYDTRIPLSALDEELRHDAAKARRWLAAASALGFAERTNGTLELTERGAFWLHLALTWVSACPLAVCSRQTVR